MKLVTPDYLSFHLDNMLFVSVCMWSKRCHGKVNKVFLLVVRTNGKSKTSAKSQDCIYTKSDQALEIPHGIWRWVN